MSKNSNWANTWWPPVEDTKPIVMCFRCGADCVDDAGRANHECAGLLLD